MICCAARQLLSCIQVRKCLLCLLLWLLFLSFTFTFALAPIQHTTFPTLCRQKKEYPSSQAITRNTT